MGFVGGVAWASPYGCLEAALILSDMPFVHAVLSAFSVIFAHLLSHIARHAPQQTDKYASKIQLNSALDKTKADSWADFGRSGVCSPKPADYAQAVCRPASQCRPSAQSLPTRSVRDTDSPAPQHSVLKAQSIGSAPMARIMPSMACGSSRRSKPSTLCGLTSRHP